MGDISEVAKLLIGKAEEYGQLLGTKAFPLFVQRQILWGHVNRALAWVGVGLFILSIVFAIIGSSADSGYDFFMTSSTILFLVSIPMAIACSITSTLQLNSPEFEAIKAILNMIVRSGK
jgi:hypothetical protein